MTDTDFSQKIMSAIKDEKITLIPRWRFLAKDSIFWFGFLLCATIGGLAFSVVLFVLTNNDWEIYDKAESNLFVFFFETLPYFWLIILVLFLAVAYFNLRHTKSGYHYHLLFVLGAVILASIFLGAIFCVFGMNHDLENVFRSQLPFYDVVASQKEAIWNRPEKGILSGYIAELDKNEKIEKVSSSVSFDLQDASGRIWHVILVTSTVLRQKFFEDGSRVKIVGSQIGSDSFQADEVRPWPVGLRRLAPQLVSP
ncbi:MAG: hypothetical protein WCP18_04240 [bacterium]